MTTLADVDALAKDERFDEAIALLDGMPDTVAKQELLEALRREQAQKLGKPTLADVEVLVNQERFREALAVLKQVPESYAKMEYGEMFYRVWSYTEEVGLEEMGVIKKRK
jgi:hypothetical protein